MKSSAATVQSYLAGLPEDRRAALEAVRRVILKNLDKGYEEGMQYGMIGYFVPHRVYPAGYHCDPKQPLPYAGLASQKNYMSLYLGSIYGSWEQEERFRAAWAESGKKLDRGKVCIRFKKLEDLPLEVIGRAIRESPAASYIAQYEAGRRELAARKPAKSRAAPKAATKVAGKQSAAKGSGSRKVSGRR